MRPTREQCDFLVCRLADEALSMLFRRARERVLELYDDSGASSEAVTSTTETFVRRTILRLAEMTICDCGTREGAP